MKRTKLADDALFALLRQRDPNDNGRFVVGVVTTGIYCLPSCPSRNALRTNLRFFATEQDARNTGLRPCLRCRPDLFYRGNEWFEDLFEQTAASVRENPAAFPGVATVAKAADLTQILVRRLFLTHAHQSPEAFLQHARVIHATRLLASGVTPSEAATAAGFHNLNIFANHFITLTGMTPADFSQLGTSSGFTLQLPPQYRSESVLAFHGRDPEGPSERVAGNQITKCLDSGLLTMRLEARSVACMFEDLSPHLAHRTAVRMLGLGQEAPSFERRFKNDTLIGPILTRQQGLRIPLSATPWEGLAWAITGQQIGLGFAIALRSRLIRLAGHKHPGGFHSHPDPSAVARLEVADLTQLQFSKSKAEYLLNAARKIAAGELDLDGLRDLSARRAARLLTNLRGIGPWTVDYLFLRGLGFPDSLPSGDAGIAQGLERLTGTRPSGPEIRELAARYSPWRSLAAAHIWASLNTGNSV